MSETPTPSESRAVAVRERLITQAPVAIWDTADFDQMQRVGLVLAKSGLVPESLCKQGDEWLPEAVVVARCVLICNQARLWGADPLSVLQCTSLINGRLMYEGKLVNAVVQHLTGVKLRFELGRWDTDHFVAVPKDELGGLADRLAIRCYDPTDEAREVSGSVGMWKTARSGSPWSNVGNWPRQLRYRAAREWARAYEPGAILGILAEGDEDLDTVTEAPRTSGVMQRLSGGQNGAGFDHAQVISQTAPKKGRGKKAARAPETPHDPDTGEILDGDDIPDMSAPVVTPGHATPGEAYVLAGQQPEGGRFPTFKDGQPFSSVANLAGVPVYAEHAPEVQDAEVGELEGNAPTETAGAQNAEPEPASSASATPASTVSPAAAEGSSPPTSSEPPETGSPEADDDELPPALSAYIDQIEAARDFVTVKKALKDLMGTDFWKGIDNAQANRIRANTWDTMVDNFAPKALPNPRGDLSAFRIWVEAQDDAEAITAALAALEGVPAFTGAADGLKEQLRGAAQNRIDSLEP